MLKKIMIILLVIASFPVSARERNHDELIKIATNILYKNTTRTDGECSISDITDGSNYVIMGNQDGFVVLSKDDAWAPVLGYTNTPFNHNNMPCGFNWWLSTIDQTMSTRGAADDGWPFQLEAIQPLLTTNWGQGDPFNYLCPLVGGKKAPTGCVATAMSQILYYYRYPAAGDGKGYYTMGDNSYQQIVTINSTYQWDAIKDTYTNSWFLSDTEKEAIGQLLYDAGVSSHMNYSTGGSGTTEFEAANALSQVFKYDSLAMRCLERDYCSSDAEWLTAIYEELKQGKPLLICGQDANVGGHAFVIDGIDSDGNVHVNWGWNGTADGFYNVKDLCPTGILGSSSTEHFNIGQSVITGLRCNPTPEEGMEYHSRWVISVKDTLKTDELNGLTLSSPDGILWQHHHLVFYGKVGLVFLDDKGNEVLFHTFFDTADRANGMSPIDGGHGYLAKYFSRISTADLASLPAGTYRVFLASKAIQEDVSQHICYPGGKYNEYIVTKAANNSLTVKTQGGETGINPFRINRDSQSTIYDLQGRNMGTDLNALPRGIYITDGKKVIK